jgi:hypothetical protein
MACCVAKIIFSEGIQKLVQHWNKCVEKQEDFVKNDALLRSVLLVC